MSYTHTSPYDASSDPSREPPTISEQQVIDGFHLFLQSALAQAKAEKLLDAETLASAEADLMVSGMSFMARLSKREAYNALPAPALCLFFAALRSTTSPPSVPLPSKGLKTSFDQFTLSSETCPPVFSPMFKVWESTVPIIQRLQSNRQHDLARLICDLEPTGHRHALNVIATQLRGVAIEISQRRTFQERFQADLQAALDGNGRTTEGTPKAQFTPPPYYVEKQSSSSNGLPSSTSKNSLSDTKAKTLLEDEPTIVHIRETLFASLGDVISSTPSLKNALNSDPPRAYFASVALAILEVSLTPQGSVRGVLSKRLTAEDCPAPLRPLMLEFDSVAEDALRLAAEDDEDAIRMAAEGASMKEPRVDMVKRILLDGMGESEMSRPSMDEDELRMNLEEGRALQFATRINMLALKMTSLPTFRSYARNVFDILEGVV